MGVYAITNETPLLYNAVHMNARRRVHAPITISTCFACSKIGRLRLDKFQLQFHPFPLPPLFVVRFQWRYIRVQF